MSLAAGIACEFSLALLLNLAIFAAIGESSAIHIMTCVSQTRLQDLRFTAIIAGVAAHSSQLCSRSLVMAMMPVLITFVVTSLAVASGNSLICRNAAESCWSLVTVGRNSNACGCWSWADRAKHESSTCIQLELLSAGAVAVLLAITSARVLVMPSCCPRSLVAAGAVWGGTLRQTVGCSNALSSLRQAYL